MAEKSISATSSSVQLLSWNGQYGHLIQYPDLHVISTYLRQHTIQFLPFSRNLSPLSGTFQLPLEVTCMYSHCANLTLTTAFCDNAVIYPKDPREIPAAQWVKFKILHSKITYPVLCHFYVPIQFSVCSGTHCSHKSKQYHDLLTLFLYNPSNSYFSKTASDPNFSKKIFFNWFWYSLFPHSWCESWLPSTHHSGL